MRPGGPVFMQPQFMPAPPWRQQLRIWQSDPKSNTIRRLAMRADAGQQTEGKQPTEQQMWATGKGQ
jgi:hypothetical protein